ncbi:DNA cytosine methyltransferase [Herbaspirillum rubrisubalbicans]|uniref:DNA cytosine methyltransferase n=1 Tax=Herbaspirillum rubrisubalbicans TaxID=80842 RepID=UPI00209C7884|nr:DNA cytosine methyltransferase [Herbaspirillum rubrisubalbicans]
MSGAYYNEIEPFAAAWLRELIKGGHIAAGEVDTRSIEDVRPDDLRGFEQCHFFAGIGGWSLALRRAGWPDDRPIWTGSCPCQPFSSAGQGAGFNDERHLWPAFHWLIQEHRPAVVAGEQVASKDADTWLDLVQDDLEALGYAFGAVAFPSAGVGAPHIRDRTYWMAYASSARSFRGRQLEGGYAEDQWGKETERQRCAFGSEGLRAPGRLAQYDRHGCGAPAVTGLHNAEHHAKSCCGAGRLANTGSEGLEKRQRHPGEPSSPQGGGNADARSRSALRRGEPNEQVIIDADTGFATGPTNGLWRTADWILCRDGKWRPVEPGTFPLAHGVPARVGRLRGYGNAINAEQAAIFIEVMRELL